MYKLFGSGLEELTKESKALDLGANIHLVKGDLIKYTDEMYRCDVAIMHQVNCKGVMGAGLAKQIASRYPEALREYKAYCNKNGSKALGTALGVRVPGGNFVINLFGQDEYSRTKQCTDYKALDSALAQARQLMLKNQIDHAVIPYGLGCGLGGGDWNIVLELIRKAFDKKYTFNNSRKAIQIYIFKKEETTMKTIDSFNFENAFLSNMYPCKVEYEGLTYTCSEAAFQAAKCKKPIDRVAFTKLDGKAARALGRSLEIRSDWNQIRYTVMYNVVYNKFMQNKALYEKLMATKGTTLVEGNTWNDKYWGVCKGEGENKLGKILMDIRDNKKEANTMKSGSITIAGAWQVDPKQFDEAWAIVRSPKCIPQGFTHVPELAPSWGLFSKYLALRDQGNWNADTFKTIYYPQFLAEFEKSSLAKAKLEELIDKYKEGKSIALVCFCHDEKLCHRSIISELLNKKGISNNLVNHTVLRVNEVAKTENVIKKEATTMKKPILKKEANNMPKIPLIIAATNSVFKQGYGKEDVMNIAMAQCPEDHMLYTFTGERVNGKVAALSLLNIFNNKVIPAHEGIWDPALYTDTIGADGVDYPYGTMDAQTKMEYVYAYIKRTFGSLDALVFTTPYDDDRSLVNTFDKVSVFIKADGHKYVPATYKNGVPIVKNGKPAYKWEVLKGKERYVRVSSKWYLAQNFEKDHIRVHDGTLRKSYKASYINDSSNYWSDEYDCMIEKDSKSNSTYALKHAFRPVFEEDMSKDLKAYEKFKQVFDCHDYKVRRDLTDAYVLDPNVSKDDVAQDIEYMKAVQKFIAETGHAELFMKDRNCPECNKHFTGDVCPRCGHKYDEDAADREISIGSIKIMDMIGRDENGDIVVGTETADESAWAEDEDC